MQEWVDTLRLKLREMKILSPKENLYSKLPEVRPPLLPTRDPTRDPLPATPPVPAAIVPGVEPQTSRTPALPLSAAASSTSNSPPLLTTTAAIPLTEPSASSSSDANERSQNLQNTSPSRNQSENDENSDDSFAVDTLNTTLPPLSSISNTLSQNLIKMLYPLPNFGHQSNDATPVLINESESDESFISESLTLADANDANSYEKTDENLHSFARTFTTNVLFDPNTSSNSKRSQNAVSNSNTSQSGGALANNRDSAEGI